MYLKYFRDKEKYAKEYAKYEHQYLDGMKSLYESAFSYITKQIDKRIDAIEKEKDSAIESLETQKEAAEEAYQAQIDAIEYQIESIDNVIDKKNEEIDAINKAADARQREIDLQKAQYNLERMQNQKTALVYRDGQGMVYESDTSEIQNARQEVEDAKQEIQIANIEDEINSLEKQKEMLEDQQELLEEALNKSNEYYDNLIEQTEKQYDTMVQGLEEYKEQFTELSELMENVQMESTLQELGINIEAILGSSQEEFNKLKTAYVGILYDMSSGNSEITNQLSNLSGVTSSYLESTKAQFGNLGTISLGELPTETQELASSAGELSTSASEASTAVGSVSESASGASQSIGTVNTSVSQLRESVELLRNAFLDLEFPVIGEEGYVDKLNALAGAFSNIQIECAKFSQLDFSSIIGVAAGGGGVSPAAQTQQENAENSSGAGTGFMGLASAINEAVTIIWLKMSSLQSALAVGNEALQAQADKIKNEYIPTWENLQTRLGEIIGVGGGGTDAGTPQGVNSGGSEGTGSIIENLQIGGEEVSQKLQDPWLKSFEEFATGEYSIQSICTQITEIVQLMAESIKFQCEAVALDLQELAENSLAISTSPNGSSSATIVSANTNGTVGNAFASGTHYNGLPHAESNALRSEYGQPELTVYPNGKTELTTKPVMSDLPKGTVIYNEAQTNEILSGNTRRNSLFGKSFSNGTFGSELPSSLPSHLRHPRPGDAGYELLQKIANYQGEIAHLIKPIAYDVNRATEASIEHFSRYENVTSNYHQGVNIKIGDIHLSEIQSADSLANEICNRLPSLILQKTKSIY